MVSLVPIQRAVITARLRRRTRASSLITLTSLRDNTAAVFATNNVVQISVRNAECLRDYTFDLETSYLVLFPFVSLKVLMRWKMQNPRPFTEYTKSRINIQTL